MTIIKASFIEQYQIVNYTDASTTAYYTQMNITKLPQTEILNLWSLRRTNIAIN